MAPEELVKVDITLRDRWNCGSNSWNNVSVLDQQHICRQITNISTSALAPSSEQN